MRYWFGYLTAGIFAAITWLLTRFGERYATLVDMVYPYVVRTLQEYLASSLTRSGRLLRWCWEC